VILPTKHLRLRTSLLGRGADLLRALERPATPSRLWVTVRGAEEEWSYADFVLALDMLYAADAIDLRDGRLFRRRP
jgi:hypothetical protein